MTALLWGRWIGFFHSHRFGFRTEQRTDDMTSARNDLFACARKDREERISNLALSFNVRNGRNLKVRGGTFVVRRLSQSYV